MAIRTGMVLRSGRRMTTSRARRRWCWAIRRQWERRPMRRSSRFSKRCTKNRAGRGVRSATPEVVERHGVFYVKAKAHYRGWSASFVIAGASDVLPIGREGNASPDVGGVVGLEDFLEPVGESAIAQDEAQAAEFQVAAMIAGNAVGDIRD